MDKQPDLEFQRVLENVRSHFGFLFNRGYQIASAMFTDENNENWNVMLAGDNCLLKVSYRDGTLHLHLCSLQLLEKTGMFDLHEIVSLIHRKRILSKRRDPAATEAEQLIATAWLLESHLDEILDLFQRIYIGMALSKAGKLSSDNSPTRFFYHVNPAQDGILN